jgi:hypothetical protein
MTPAWASGYHLWRGIELGDRTQQFARITEDHAEILEILIGQVWEDGEINPILVKTLRILGHAKLFEPLSNIVHYTVTKSGFRTSEPEEKV